MRAGCDPPPAEDPAGETETPHPLRRCGEAQVPSADPAELPAGAKGSKVQGSPGAGVWEEPWALRRPERSIARSTVWRRKSSETRERAAPGRRSPESRRPGSRLPGPCPQGTWGRDGAPPVSPAELLHSPFLPPCRRLPQSLPPPHPLLSPPLPLLLPITSGSSCVFFCTLQFSHYQHLAASPPHAGGCAP